LLLRSKRCWQQSQENIMVRGVELLSCMIVIHISMWVSLNSPF